MDDPIYARSVPLPYPADPPASATPSGDDAITAWMTHGGPSPAVATPSRQTIGDMAKAVGARETVLGEVMFKSWEHVRKFAMRLQREAVAAKVGSETVQQHPQITLTARQLREALELINPDGLEGPDGEMQQDNELTFGIKKHQGDNGKVSMGMCCWNDDTDGVLPLHDDAPVAEVYQ